MAKRNEWTITYPAGVVAKAATSRKIFHETRLEHWQQKTHVTEKELRENGIELDEEANLYASNSLQPRFNSALWKAFQDCRSKVTEHGNKVNAYSAWERALTLAAERSQTVELDVEDVEFFQL